MTMTFIATGACSKRATGRFLINFRAATRCPQSGRADLGLALLRCIAESADCRAWSEATDGGGLLFELPQAQARS